MPEEATDTAPETEKRQKKKISKPVNENGMNALNNNEKLSGQKGIKHDPNVSGSEEGEPGKQLHCGLCCVSTTYLDRFILII